MHEELIEMFQKYPIGIAIRLKDDYPHEVNIIVGYESYGSEWYLKLSKGTSINVKRLSELLVVN